MTQRIKGNAEYMVLNSLLRQHGKKKWRQKKCWNNEGNGRELEE